MHVIVCRVNITLNRPHPTLVPHIHVMQPTFQHFSTSYKSWGASGAQSNGAFKQVDLTILAPAKKTEDLSAKIETSGDDWMRAAV